MSVCVRCLTPKKRVKTPPSEKGGLDRSMSSDSEPIEEVDVDVDPITPNLSSKAASSDAKAEGAKEAEVGRERSREHCLSSSSKKDKLEVFSPSFQVRDLPVVSFNADVTEQTVWYDGSVKAGQVCYEGQPDVRISNPVVMSNAYKGFAIEPYETRYLHYYNVGIVFARPMKGRFMQPSIDTILVCRGLLEVFRGEGAKNEVCRLIDIGSGSGFIGKFAAVHAPGDKMLEATLVDIDPEAMKYSRSPGFNAPDQGQSGRQISWQLHAEDALGLLEADSNFDLLVSNPPYIPTKAEARMGAVEASPGGFWEGISLVVYLLELASGSQLPKNARLVMMVTSLTLKSPAVISALKSAAAKGAKIRVVLEREIAWKAWYAGPNGLNYLLATPEEYGTRVSIPGCGNFFVGATEPGNSRTGTDNRDRWSGYHWHVAYVLEVQRPS
eukprot:TRINITY_DN64140_c0_g1_i1.p1 TRINITY_DN64140_c0_g1~~TRINITY_DN64140_c0_g1_i1.p1  ORF type:complete len:440 (+),score=76.51 TRINITY_DN64140_c0_g1_i1:75-1394(+)